MKLSDIIRLRVYIPHHIQLGQQLVSVLGLWEIDEKQQGDSTSYIQLKPLEQLKRVNIMLDSLKEDRKLCSRGLES